MLRDNPVFRDWKTSLTAFLSVSAIFACISFFADIKELLPWLKYLSDLINLTKLSYGVNVLLLLTLLFFLQNKSSSEKYTADLNSSLWRRTIRTLRSIMLPDLPTPQKRDALDPILDELAKRLPNYGKNYKMAIAQPSANGKFKIIAARGMDPGSITKIEQRSDWKENKSFFSNALSLDDNKNFARYKTGGTNYVNIQNPKADRTSASTSSSHFLIAIKSTNYYNIFPGNTLAILSIGIPLEFDFDESQENSFYMNIYPVTKSIEGILLSYQIVENGKY